MLQPRQNNLLTRLLDLARQENLIQNGIDLVEIEDQIQLTDIPEELVQHFHEEVYRFQVGQLVVVCVHTCAEEETGVPAVDDLGAASEFHEVGLVLLVPGGDEAVDLALELEFGVVGVGIVPFGQASFASEGIGLVWGGVGDRGGGKYWRFWMRMKERTIVGDRRRR